MLIVLQLILFFLNTSFAGLIDPTLNIQPKAKQNVVLLMSPECINLPSSVSQDRAINLLKRQSKQCAQNIAAAIGVPTSDIRPLWISHAVGLTVTDLQIKLLAQNPNVLKIYFNHSFSRTESLAQSAGDTPEEAPYNLEQINYNKLKSQFPDVNGKGESIGLIDTGVDASHKDLRKKVTCFFDADENKLVTPQDRAGHGTHVAGLLVADKIGIAPQAKIVAAKMLNIESALRAMQFIAEYKKIKVVNNSWGEQDLPDIEIYYRAFNLWESLNIIPVFSAGNLGPKERSISHPKEHPSVIVVGATTAAGSVAKYSSRGPVSFANQDIQRPDLVAPGDKIISTLPENKYGVWSGTSMSAPLVSATIALMQQASPNLRPKDIRNLLIGTTTTTDHTWKPDRGYGILNTYSAVISAMSPTTNPPLSIMSFGFFSPPIEIDPNTLTNASFFEFPRELDGKNWL